MSSVCLMNFGNGLSDSAPGARIPYMETHYTISYTVVSLIFVTNAIGFMSAAFFVDAIRARLGRAKTLMIAQSLMTCGYMPIVCTPPWLVVIVCFFFLWNGMALNLALGNVFAANLHNRPKMLGAMHGSYGVGGAIGPLIATAMVSQGHLLWSRYYLIPLSITLFNLAFAAWSFWHYEAEVERTRRAKRQHQRAIGQHAALPQKQNSEVSISGWVISFLITTRHGNPANVGYVTSGFWASITLGRFLLSHLAHKIGEKVFVCGMVKGAAIFQLLVWLVPNVIGNAVAVSICFWELRRCGESIHSRILAGAVGTFVLHPILYWFVCCNVDVLVFRPDAKQEEYRVGLQKGYDSWR
ncbi:MFS efflux transporter [Drepanopeziza brunnea f. sp. 'multigermtubi' MB_m1]|uniref:MFS efflux transporter n=1 Tax=Marssonina brunnea f. sp. multigermtubi (strain MB_m1) TaxID=1072389 RepID=K1WVR3_MARBU|nr:MFS efflux transporter [Drepanopeziza brunnea f. sp. 'multigermtubi' MB_m1]EKD21720.1 MFS efflux transporter [Drepanopeziza brunnea f. sp. 'multigermtubi' MB_m1]